MGKRNGQKLAQKLKVDQSSKYNSTSHAVLQFAEPLDWNPNIRQMAPSTMWIDITEFSRHTANTWTKGLTNSQNCNYKFRSVWRINCIFGCVPPKITWLQCTITWDHLYLIRRLICIGTCSWEHAVVRLIAKWSELECHSHMHLSPSLGITTLPHYCCQYSYDNANRKLR